MKKLQIEDFLNFCRSKNRFGILKPPFFVSALDTIVNCTIPTVIFLQLFIHADNFSANQMIILGIFISSVTTFFILLATLKAEKRKDILSARKSAKILSDVMKSVCSQVMAIRNGSRHIIDYPENWLEYYADCSLYLEYDYLEVLLREFEIIKKINKSLNSDDIDEIKSLILYRNKTITDFSFEFDVLSAESNLSLFSLGNKESPPWSQEKSYFEFLSFFCDTYANKVNELTVEYLSSHGGSSDSNDVKYYVMEKLKSEAALSDGKFSYIASKNKAMLEAIFRVYLMKGIDRQYDLTWGTLSLRKE